MSKLLDAVMWKAFAPFFKKMVWSASRLGLGVLAGWLMKKGFLDAGDVPEFVSVVAPIVGALVWTAIETHKDLVLNNTLAAMPVPTPVAEAKALIKEGISAPAMVSEHDVPTIKEPQ